jgi:Rieske Fe-S protein
MFKEIHTSRRKIIVTAGLGVSATALAACSTSGKTPAGHTSSGPTDSGGSGAPASDAPKGVLAKTAAVPVGSGVIVDDIVVTQPAAGHFLGFSSVCTHAGCHVADVTGGKIVCPCHGSEFNLDGTVARGPATKPLAAKSVSVQGDSIVEG